MEPIEYLRIARRRWWVIVLGGLLAVVAVVITTPAGSRTVRSTSQSFIATEVLVLQPGADALENNLKKLAFLTTVGEVPRRVAKEVRFDGPPAVLASKISVTVEEQVAALRISATDPDGNRAALLASTFAKQLLLSVEEAESARLEQARKDAFGQVEQISAAIAEIDRRSGANPDAAQRATKDVYQRQLVAATERAQQLAFPAPPRSGFITLEQATPIPANTERSFDPPKSRSGRMLLVGMLGVLVACGVAVVLDRLDPRVHSREGAEAAFGLPVLAEVPTLRRRQRRGTQVSAANDPGSAVAQAYRMLRTAVLLTPLPASRNAAHLPSNGAEPLNGGPPRVVLITSAEPGEGTTTVVANLAASFAESGQSVLVIACDFSNPRIHQYLGAGGGEGVTDFLADRSATLRLRDLVQESSVAGVRLLPSGTAHLRTSLALSGGMLAEAREMADVILIDAGSLFGSSEAGELVGLVDSVLLVAQVGRTNNESAERASELLARFGAPASGVILLGLRSIRVKESGREVSSRTPAHVNRPAGVSDAMTAETEAMVPGEAKAAPERDMADPEPRHDGGPAPDAYPTRRARASDGGATTPPVHGHAGPEKEIPASASAPPPPVGSAASRSAQVPPSDEPRRKVTVRRRKAAPASPKTAKDSTGEDAAGDHGPSPHLLEK